MAEKGQEERAVTTWEGCSRVVWSAGSHSGPVVCGKHTECAING